MPIYDNPDHPFYGPCRRLHLILMALFADAPFTKIEEVFEQQFDMDWTNLARRMLDIGCHEAAVGRGIVHLMFECQELIRRREQADRATCK